MTHVFHVQLKNRYPVISTELWGENAQEDLFPEITQFLGIFLPSRRIKFTQNQLSSIISPMNINIIPAHNRYTARHDWLESKHLFSFADYYDPKNMHFGILRVFNDDLIAGHQGF